MSIVKKMGVGFVGAVFVVSMMAGNVFAGGKGGKWKKKEYKEWIKEKKHFQKDWRDDIRAIQSSNQQAYNDTSQKSQGIYLKQKVKQHDSKMNPKKNTERKMGGEMDNAGKMKVPNPR